MHPAEYLRIAAYIYNETDEPIRAFPFMQKAVELSPVDDPAIEQMLFALSQAGLDDLDEWVERLRDIQEQNREVVND